VVMQLQPLGELTDREPLAPREALDREQCLVRLAGEAGAAPPDGRSTGGRRDSRRVRAHAARHERERSAERGIAAARGGER